MDVLAPLDQPFACKSLVMKNRFVMAPMTRYFAPGGIPTEQMASYYRRRAEGGIGLIVTEGLGIDRGSSRAVDLVPNFCGAAALTGWKRIVDGVHEAGAAFAPQLWHVGGVPDYKYPDAVHDPLESPSGLIGPDAPGGRPMTEEDIADVVASYARAAADAKTLGVDALEVHAAHGYLIDQYFWQVTNRRKGRYGGESIADRTTFAREIFQQMRRAAGEKLTLIVRISQWKLGFYDARNVTSPHDLESWLRPLVDAGVDIFDCSQRRFWEPEFEGSDLNLAGWAKKLTGQPSIAVGSVGLDRDMWSDFQLAGESRPDSHSLTELARRFTRGDFDLIAIGRALLADPTWLKKVRSGRFQELKPYSVSAMDTLY